MENDAITPPAPPSRSALHAPVIAYAFGGGFVAFALLLASQVREQHRAPIWVAIALVSLYYVAFNTEFVTSGGTAVATEPVFVGLLFLLPRGLVPLYILVCVLIPWPQPSNAPEHGVPTLRRYAVKAMAGWHCAGPLAVLAVAKVGSPELRHWPIYALALVVQTLIDLLCASARLGLSLRRLARPVAWTFSIDALLAPLGIAAVVATHAKGSALVLLAMPVMLMRVLASDRQTHIDNTAAARTEARIDQLTGLANRRAWFESLDAFLHDDSDHDCLTVLVADLDRLKVANDTLGHHVGDALIVAMAGVLRSCAPDGAVVVRLGGDEFALAISHMDGEIDGDHLLARVRAAVVDHPRVDGFRLSASLGVACGPLAGDHEAIERAADDAAGKDKAVRRMQRAEEQQASPPQAARPLP